MKTLYEILEVSESASNEVIEKAYKVLAKKYHPDLQTPENKAQAEKKMKEINEAYDILSNDQKRKEYDEELSRKLEIENQKNNMNRNMGQTQQTTTNAYTPPYTPNMQNTTYNKAYDMQRRRYQENLRKEEQKMRKQMQENLEKEYEEAYYGYLRSLGYKIKERWTWKRTKELLVTIVILIAIGIILWFLPPTHQMLVDFYESSPIIKTVIDIIINIIKAIFGAIQSIFTGGK